jgi:hypothetical protein
LGKLLTSVRARLLSLRSVKGADGGSTLVGSWLPSWSPPGVSLIRGGDNNCRQHAEAERAVSGRWSDGGAECRSSDAARWLGRWDRGAGGPPAAHRRRRRRTRCPLRTPATAARIRSGKATVDLGASRWLTVDAEDPRVIRRVHPVAATNWSDRTKQLRLCRLEEGVGFAGGHARRERTWRG